MFLSKKLQGKAILVKTSAKTRWDIIKELVSLAAQHNLISSEYEDEICQSLVAREKTMTTGIGKGVALPHCKTPLIKDIVILLATSAKGINFEAIDNLPAKIIVMLLVPTAKAEKHVKVLSAIARVLSDEEFKNELASCEDSSAVIRCIETYERKK